MSATTDLEDGRELAQWLADAGRRVERRRAPGPRTESSDERIRCLEELAGRPLLTREDIREYVDELNRQRVAAEAALRRRSLWRETLLVSLAAGAFLQYYFWDVYLTIERLPKVVVSAPARPAS